MNKITISTSEDTKSEIIIENDLKNKIEDYFEDKKYFLITNTTLAKLYPEFVYKFAKNRTIIIKDGEKHKNIKTFEYIINRLLEEKIERKDAIVAFGGGVVGDLAGFVSSSILRGVELIQIPTTLLAMCDSSIGGKTGFNSKFGKNLIGSFHLAKKVLIDTAFLDTLNEYEYKCGLGEVLKYAFIEKSCDKNSPYDLMDFLIKNQKDDIKRQMDFIVRACADLKARVVQKDAHEGNLRKILNFGHTWAHPVETLANYKKISHGQAVAWGIRCATELAFNKKLIDEGYYNLMISLLKKYELINKKIKFKKEKITELMAQDKKVQNGKINLLLPVGFAEVALFDNIDLPSIEASLP